MKFISAKELHERGYLFYANIKLFHPLGLALTIRKFKNRLHKAWYYLKMSYKALFSKDMFVLHGLMDYRHDPEGMEFTEQSMERNRDKYSQIDKEFSNKCRYREDKLGFKNGIQMFKNGPN